MHILFFTDNYPPETNAPATRTYEHAREWVKFGHSVTIVTCAPNFPKGEVFPNYKNRLWQVEYAEGIRIVRVWSYITANEGIIRRTLDYLSYMLTSFIASFFIRKVDVIVGTSPQFFTAVSAWLSSVFKNVPFIFEVRDIWPESIVAVGALKQSRIIRHIEKLELFLYHKAKLVVVVTNAFKVNLISRSIPAEKIKIVTNGANLSAFSRRGKDNSLVKKYKLKNKFTIGYIGTHGLAHSLETIISVAEILQTKESKCNFQFIFVGDGASKVNLETLANEKKLRNVIFVDNVSKEDVVRYWSILDLSIVHLKKNDVFKTVIPSKIFESMAMGVPIIHCVEGESAEIISHHNVGVVAEPENKKEIADAIVSVSSQKDFITRMSENSILAAREYDRRNLASNMLCILEEAIKDD